MPSDESATGYFIWGADFKSYGPVDLPTLVSWIKDERVLAETWIFLERSGCWEKAEHVPELQMFFHKRSSAAQTSDVRTGNPDAGGLSPSILRHIKILAGLNDEQLARFVSIMQVKNIFQGEQLVKQGEHGDGMYLLVEGQLQLRAHAEGRESTVGTINAGDFFGEISLFDHGPRSANVIALKDSTLVKIPTAEFEKFVYETPDLAAPILLALTKSLTSRIRAENRRYRDSIAHLHPAGAH
jgi:CRP-like cAMP-binding protein